MASPQPDSYAAPSGAALWAGRFNPLKPLNAAAQAAALAAGSASKVVQMQAAAAAAALASAAAAHGVPLAGAGQGALLAAGTLATGGGAQSFDEGVDAGTQWYVRPNGSTYGAGSGTSWTNAWSGFSGIAWESVAAGDTIWIAGGTYTQQLTPSKSGTNGNRVKIRRARADASACTSASGWSAAFDSTVLQVGVGVTIGNFSYFDISGATTQSGGTQGWHINFNAEVQGAGFYYNASSTSQNCNFRWIHLEGPGIDNTYPGAGGSGTGGRGIDATPFAGATAAFHTYSHCVLHDWESTAYVAIPDFTFEWCEFYNVFAENWVDYHPNMVYVTDAPRLTFRYNHCHGLIGEGVFFTNNDVNVDTAYIYGNLFENTKDGGTTTKCIQPDNTGTFTGLKIWNNTFDNCYNVMYGDSAFASSEARNNLVTRSGSGSPWLSGITASNNLVMDTDPNANNCYVNRAGGDYRIVSTTGANYPRNAGTLLTSDGFIDKDMDGNTRGSDGTWDVGAYEFA